MRIITPGETRTRVRRRPSFPMFGTMRPFGLYPLMATPVLPGETLTSMQLKRRVLSLPVRNPLMGAWLETWLVYVKLTDMDEALAAMFLTNDADDTEFEATASSDRYFTRQGQIAYIERAVRAVWHHYFRDESETTPHTLDGVPMVKRRSFDWTHNLSFTPAGMDLEELPSNPEGQLTGMDIMSMMGMSEITYEKYLQQYGVSSAAAAKTLRAPEILRYSQQWVVPTNQIDPTTGAPSSAWVWSEDMKADKPKRFDEPGFLVLLSCVRPKMFSDAMRYSFVGNLWGIADFFPVYNLDNPAAGVKEIKTDDLALSDNFGPDGGSSLSLLYDHRDLLSHGEQFINNWSTTPYFVPKVTTQRAATVGADPQELRGQYASLQDVQNMFVESQAETPRQSHMGCFYEGLCAVEITGHVKDTTL